MIKVYKIQNKKNNLFWSGKYKKCDEKGKAWCRVEELTKDLAKVKKIPKDWVILEFEILPLCVTEIPIPKEGKELKNIKNRNQSETDRD